MPVNLCYASWYRDFGGGELRMMDHLRHSSCRPEEVLVFVNGKGPLADSLAQAGFGVRVFRWDRWKGWMQKNVSWAIARRQVSLELSKSRPALVVCNTFPDLWSVGRVAARLGLPLIWRARGDLMPEYQQWPENRQREFRDFIRDSVSRVLCTTQHEADLMKDAGLDMSKIAVIRNGVDLQAFAGPPAGDPKLLDADLDVTGPVIGFAARMVPQKGFEVFFEAIGILQRQGLDFHVLVAGDAVLHEDPETYKAQLFDLAAKLGIESSVSFLGFQRDMATFMAAIDIFVLASLKEPFGTTIIEAMAASRPVVASDLPGPRESILDCESGYFFEPGDTWDLAEKISLLIRSPDLRKSFGQSGRRRAEALFDQRTNLAMLDEECAAIGGW